ncbi:MAG: alanine racemase [Candidatus Zixiibacteriota bacterium]
MAELTIKTRNIIGNIKKLDSYLSTYDLKWTLILKILSGNQKALERILEPPSVDTIHSVGDSRLSSLKKVKQINPDLMTMYIKPPAISYVDTVIEYADISLNTSFTTIKALNRAAKRQDKLHKVIIMIELGELREGVMRENLIEFYDKVFSLSNIEVIGIGTNLGCMYGIMPTYDKLIQLSLYHQLLETKFNRDIVLNSGGSSITLPLIPMKKLPKAVNHLRLGEAVFMGTTPMDGKVFRNLSLETFDFSANIIELEQKESLPDGVMSEGNVGHTSEDEEEQLSPTEYEPKPIPKSYRAILDFGILDVDMDTVKPSDETVDYIGTTSDMTVVDLGENVAEDGKPRYKIGDKIHFNLDYMAVARLMNSKFIDKVVE